jgi:hypothetical protein
MAVEFRFLELKHYDNSLHFERFARVAEARKRECTVLLPSGIDLEAYFDGFVDRILDAIRGQAYLPVARFCDGEYSFYTGRTTTTCWGEKDSSLAADGVEDKHVAALRTISDRGFLCPNLNLVYMGIQSDFLSFLSARGMPLRNYAPFYFVYALLVNPRFLAALRGRRVALISNFANKNTAGIRAALESHGISDVEYHELPGSGVAHGDFRLKLERRPEVALVGAGIGAPLVLHALQDLSCPCIDSGFVFHLWDGSYDRHERLFLNYVG